MSRGKILHTRNRKSEITLENATDNPLDISVKSTGQVIILQKIPQTSEITLENASENPLGNDTENARTFLRCRFLACNCLPLVSCLACKMAVVEKLAVQCHIQVVVLGVVVTKALFRADFVAELGLLVVTSIHLMLH